MTPAAAGTSSLGLTRRALLRLGAGLGAALALPRAARAGEALAPQLADVWVETDGLRFAGDRRMFATLSPSAGDRNTAVVRFLLERPATVKVEAVRKGMKVEQVVWTTTRRFAGGSHGLRWRPEAALEPGNYLMRMTLERSGVTRIYGRRRPAAAALSRAPVIRILGVEASFGERSYGPGERASLRVAADAQQLQVQVFRSGPELENTDRNDELKGVPVTDPVSFDWAPHRSRARAITVGVGAWPSGLYFAKLTTEDGRLGFAPFIVRAPATSTSRIAVVLPTNTWQAYNLRDSDGDGWGDTWYVGGSPPVRLDRPFLQRGVPPRFRRYDLPFLRWLEWTGKSPDVYSEEDLARFRSGDELRARYDLVVFPGHHEYVTEHMYDVIERYRDLGGSLIFLSANNFFWKVEQRGAAIHRTALWRELKRPEARLLGSQYRANDDGTRQGPFYVTNHAAAPWLFAGTGLSDGSTIGEHVGGYGIEIDATTPDSPPGTQVLAVIPNLFGLGVHGEMTYYETPAGAKVFAAGALDFGGSVTTWPVRRMLENLWQHLTAPKPTS